MKRYGYIIEEICEWGNLCDAFKTVVRGTERKRLREGEWLIAHHDEFLESVANEIRSGHIDLGKWHPKDIMERGKQRHLQVFDMKTRIKVAAVMIVVDRYLRRRFIRTTASSIKGRGVQDLKQYIERDLREPGSSIRYWYKYDIKKFYDTVVQEFEKKCVRRVFKDKRLISILDQFIEVLPGGIGMSMGMRSSQGLCNLLLSVYLDHIIKDVERVEDDYRYCDDGVNGAEEKRLLWKIRLVVHRQVESIGQNVKPNDRVFPVSEGLDFLGYVIFPTHTRMRKCVKKSYAKKLARVKSRRRRKELVASFYGMAKHADCLHLMQTLMFPGEYNMYKRKMMKDFGKSRCNQAVNPDGKKSFKGMKVSGRELNHQSFIVLDYETGVVAKEDRLNYEALVADAIRNGMDTETVPKPKTKYLVHIVFQNQLRKLWTGDRDMWKELDERRAEGGLPFFCSLDADYSGTTPRYSLISTTALGFPMPTAEEIKRLNTNLNINIPYEE